MVVSGTPRVFPEGFNCLPASQGSKLFIHFCPNRRAARGVEHIAITGLQPGEQQNFLPRRDRKKGTMKAVGK